MERGQFHSQNGTKGVEVKVKKVQAQTENFERFVGWGKSKANNRPNVAPAKIDKLLEYFLNFTILLCSRR